MKRINSKSKGNRGERAAIEILKPKFPGLRIWRTPNSGGFATSHNITGQGMSGDLMAEVNDSKESREFHKYNFEIKNYKDTPDFLRLHSNSSEPLIKWLEHLEGESKENNLIGILIFKGNRTPFYIIFQEGYFTDKEHKPFYDKFLLKFNLKSKEYIVFNLEDVSFD